MRTVDSAVYTKEYYLNDCTHYQEFVESNGKVLGDRFVKLLPFLQIKPGMRILDVGSGRGELCIYAAMQGAEAVGVDYSQAAIELSQKAIKDLPKEVASRISFVQAPVSKMKFKKNSFDLVVCVEVLEHLYPEEIEIMLKAVTSALKPGGRAIFHTAPNHWFNQYGYRYWSYPVGSLLISVFNTFMGKHYPGMQKPSTLRTESHKVMHVNEPTYFSLKRHFANYPLDFSIGSLNITAVKPVLSWKDRLFNLITYFHPLSKYVPFTILFGDDFLVQAKKR